MEIRIRKNDDDVMLNQLLHDMREIEDVDCKYGNVKTPDNSKGICVDYETLILTFLFSPLVFKSVLDLVKYWAGKEKNKSVKIEINGNILELSNTDKETQKRLTKFFFDQLVEGEDKLELKELIKMENEEE